MDAPAAASETSSEELDRFAAASNDFVSRENLYERTTTIIDRLADGSTELVKHEVVIEQPPCQHGFGCRASSHDQERCGFDPKTGLCSGRMP